MAVLAAVFGAGLVVMIVNRILLGREIRNLARGMERIRTSSGLCRLTVGTANRSVGDLASQINLLYEENQEKQAHYIRMNEELRQSMADISHDLRTPLTAMIGYLKLMKKVESIPEQGRQYLEIIHEKSDTLYQLVTSLFDLARLEAGIYQFEWQRIELKSFLEQELASFYAMIAGAGLEPEINLTGGEYYIRGDQTALQRMTGNLLQNAIQHGEGGIRIELFRKEGMACLEMSNDAYGMTPEEVGRIFCRAYTADPARSSGNSGLGLTIVKEFTEQMGGTVRARLKGGRIIIRLSIPEIK